MTPEQLATSRPATSPDRTPDVAAEEVVRRGQELRRRYRECANRFRELVRITGARREMSGTLVTPELNLHPVQHHDLGLIRPFVIVGLSEYRPGINQGERKIPFSVETTFLGVNEQGERVSLGHRELFGAQGYHLFGVRRPNFVYIPDSHIDRPWDAADSERYDYDGGEYPWSTTNYPPIYGHLAPMIEDANNTQTWLARALRDRSLNSQLAERAVALTFGQTESPATFSV